jgi:hypothetical protein
MTTDDLEFGSADAMVDQAVAFNLGEHYKVSFRECAIEALRGIPDTAEGKRVTAELMNAMTAEYHKKAIELIATGDRAGIDAIYRRVFIDVRERVRVMCVAAEDNPGRAQAGRLHQHGAHEIIARNIKFLSDRGFNSYCAQAIEARLEKLAPGTDIVAAHFNGDVDFSDDSTMTLVEMYDELRPASISREGWIENSPTPESFGERRIVFENRQAAAERAASPWLDNGITSRDGRFHAFRDSQS